MPGFGLRVNAGGRRTWTVVYRVKGKRSRLDIGNAALLGLTEARAKAREKLAEAERGNDPKAAGETFASTTKRWLEEWVKHHTKERTAAEYKRIVDVYLAPWHERLLAGVARRDVIEMVNRLREERGGYMANRVLAILSAFFGWAINVDLIGASPAWRVPRAIRETPRDRILSAGELKALWPALHPVHWFLLYTGARRGEVLGMVAGEVDGDTWTIPAARTKSGRPHRVPLVAPALALLPLDPTGLRTAHSKAREAIHFRYHDLRRTVASGLAELGYSNEIIGAVLNHAPSGVTARVYNQWRYDAEKRAALEAWAARLAAIVAG